jgi:hypothetical protein
LARLPLTFSPGAPAALPLPLRQPFDSQDGFLDLCAFLVKFREHLQNVSSGSIAQSWQSQAPDRWSWVEYLRQGGADLQTGAIIRSFVRMQTGLLRPTIFSRGSPKSLPAPTLASR